MNKHGNSLCQMLHQHARSVKRNRESQQLTIVCVRLKRDNTKISFWTETLRREDLHPREIFCDCLYHKFRSEFRNLYWFPTPTSFQATQQILERKFIHYCYVPTILGNQWINVTYEVSVDLPRYPGVTTCNPAEGCLNASFTLISTK